MVGGLAVECHGGFTFDDVAVADRSPIFTYDCL